MQKNDEKHCPPLYAQGLFIQGFGETFFSKHFNWLLRLDPQYGSTSYEQSARLYPGRVYLMHQDFQILVHNDGWKDQTAFAPFLKAVQSILDLGDKTLADMIFFWQRLIAFSSSIMRCLANMFQKMY